MNDKGHPGATLDVLVVEDDPEAAHSLAAMIGSHGHRAEVVYDGRGAIRNLRDNDFQLVFLDIGLPDMDGYEVARRLTLLGRRGSLSIVAVSGYDSDEDLRRSDGAGLDAHLVKPCRGDQLEEILLKAMAVGHQSAPPHAELREGLSVRGHPVRPRTARL